MLIIYLSEVRLKRNISLRELGKKSGISTSQISRIECGECQPMLETMCRLADALNVPITDLYKWD